MIDTILISLLVAMHIWLIKKVYYINHELDVIKNTVATIIAKIYKKDK